MGQVDKCILSQESWDHELEGALTMFLDTQKNPKKYNCCDINQVLEGGHQKEQMCYFIYVQRVKRKFWAGELEKIILHQSCLFTLWLVITVRLPRKNKLMWFGIYDWWQMQFL